MPRLVATVSDGEGLLEDTVEGLADMALATVALATVALATVA
jgi:hypothetical protein